MEKGGTVITRHMASGYADTEEIFSFCGAAMSTFSLVLAVVKY